MANTRTDRGAHAGPGAPVLALTLLASVGLSFAAVRALERPGDPAGDGATLEVLFDGVDLFVDFDAPAAAVIGFEHAPTTREEHDTMARAHALLYAGNALVPSPAARCGLTGSFVSVGHGYDDLCSSAAGTGAPAQAPEASDEGERPLRPIESGPREEVAARWSWVCEEPARLERIEVHLIDSFDALDAVDVRIDTEVSATNVRLIGQRSTIDMRATAATLEPS